MKKYRKINLICISLMLSIGTSWSQDRLFLNMVSFDSHIYKKLPLLAAGSQIEAFKFNPNILNLELLKVIFRGASVDFLLDELDFRGENNYSWHGRSRDKNSSIVLVYYNGQLTGDIDHDLVAYSIAPLGVNEVAVYLKANVNDSFDGPDYTNQAQIVIQKTVNARAQEDSPVKIRVLLAYTYIAESTLLQYTTYKDMVFYLQYCISRSNQFNINSNVNHRVRLACGIRVSDPPSQDGYGTILSKFMNNNDGYADEIHEYRNTYSADVCAILTLLPGNPPPAGVATGIGSTAQTAFCAVNPIDAPNSTLAHEIAHLHGCRHNPEDYTTNTPFAYGHGFRNVAEGWRTIMSYNCLPSCSYKIAYFSNPDITRNGVPIGNSTVSNNARVLNETAGTLASFRTAPETLVLGGSSSLIDEEIGEAIATSEILLQNEFTVADSSEFYAIVNSAAADDNYAPLRFRFEEKSVVKYIDQEQFMVFHNPSHGIFNIDFGQAAEGVLEVKSVLGKVLCVKRFQEVKNMELDLTKEATGIYIISVTSGSKVYTKTIMKF